MIRRPLLWLLPLLGITLGGCGNNQAKVDPLRSLAASFVAGRSFDRAQVALNRNDSAGLANVGDDLRRAAAGLGDQRLAGAFAIAVTRQATNSLDLSQLATGSERTHLVEEADRKYRAALTFVPENSSEQSLDANTLNALGYYLADRGKNRADFERAASLTLAAFENWNVSPVLVGLDPRFGRALGPQDSYAWALFKLGKFEAAREQEEEVLSLVRAGAPNLITSEIPFHMAEIYNALGDNKSARREYGEALKLKPNAELRAEIERGLKSLDFKRV